MDMKYAEPNDLAALVRKVVESSSLSSKLTGVQVEASDLNDESGFLRVLIHLKSLAELSEGDADSITSSIEGAVATRDDRFPSIRFSES